MSLQTPDITPPNIADPRKVEILVDAWLRGELQFQRAERYRGKLAELGKVYHWIHYKQGDKVVYSGAYQIKLSLENYLNDKQQLYSYIIYELAKQL